jgi:prefoldin alpha subunit
MNEISRKEKVLQYESFVNEKLRKDLSVNVARLDDLYSEISEYLQSKDIIQKLSELHTIKDNKILFKTKVDIGCNFYSNAVVESESNIFIEIGFGFFLELTFSEALKFINKKNFILDKRVDELKRKISEIKADIRFVIEGLKEIQNIDFSSGK